MAGPRGAAAAVAASPVFGGVVRALETIDRDRPDILPILTYHRVAEPDDDHHPGLISASPAAFVEQVEALARRFTFVPLDPVLDRAAGGPPIPARSIMLTFDDAYRDFAEAAWPVLGRLGIPATLFVPTAFPDTDRPFWWDRLYAALIHTAQTQPIETAAGSLALADRADRAAAFRSLRSELKSLPHAAAMAEVDRLVAELGEPGIGIVGARLGRAPLAGGGRRHARRPLARPPPARADRAGGARRRDRRLDRATSAVPSAPHRRRSRIRAEVIRTPSSPASGRSGSGRHSRPSGGSTTCAGRTGSGSDGSTSGGRSSAALIRAQSLGWLAR